MLCRLRHFSWDRAHVSGSSIPYFQVHAIQAGCWNFTSVRVCEIASKCSVLPRSENQRAEMRERDTVLVV